MLKILQARFLFFFQARFQQYMNCELPDVQAGFRKGKGTRDQIANTRWIIEKAREFQLLLLLLLLLSRFSRVRLRATPEMEAHQAPPSLGFSCFLYDPTDVGNFISGSFTFSKSSLNIWEFSVHILLKPNLENFEHYFASM